MEVSIAHCQENGRQSTNRKGTSMFLSNNSRMERKSKKTNTSGDARGTSQTPATAVKPSTAWTPAIAGTPVMAETQATQ
jgi:hypothetical protein